MHVLVAVASKHGATQEIADAIGAGLHTRGIEATVAPIADVESLAGVDAVVLGSAVYAGRWMGQARHAVKKHSDELRERPVWLFSSGPTGDDDDADQVKEAFDGTAFVEQTGARSHTIFSGELDEAKLGFLERKMIHAVHAPTGDFRDWDAVDAFTADVAQQLVDLETSLEL